MFCYTHHSLGQEISWSYFLSFWDEFRSFILTLFFLCPLSEPAGPGFPSLQPGHPQGGQRLQHPPGQGWICQAGWVFLVRGSVPGLWALGLLLRGASSPGVELVGVQGALLPAESSCPVPRGPERGVRRGFGLCVSLPEGRSSNGKLPGNK